MEAVNIWQDWLQFGITSLLQLTLAGGAWRVAWSINKASSKKSDESLKLQIFDSRFKIFKAFEVFVTHCFVQDKPDDRYLTYFQKETEKIDQLFGSEISDYHREVIRNAIAIKGIENEIPCQNPPNPGGLAGYFPGSSTFNTKRELIEWFGKQYQGDLKRYFSPYISFADVGVDRNKICMKPKKLPDAPIYKRRAKIPPPPKSEP